jgi:hypothetical protein
MSDLLRDLKAMDAMCAPGGSRYGTIPRDVDELIHRAADEIERLRAEVKLMRSTSKFKEIAQ